MKVLITLNKSYFLPKELEKLNSLGEIVFADGTKHWKKTKLDKIARNANFLVISPLPFGGYEKAKSSVSELLQLLPNVKGVCLSSTSYAWIELDY